MDIKGPRGRFRGDRQYMGEGGEDCTKKRKYSQGGMSLVIRKKERKKERRVC